MYFNENPEEHEPSGGWVPGNISQSEHWGRKESSWVTRELYSKVTWDNRDHFWCLESVFLSVYGADWSDLMPWQMTTDAVALLEISEASVMTAWVTNIIDPLPGRSLPASLTRGCYGMSSACTETYMFGFTVLLPQQFTDLINCGEFTVGRRGKSQHFSLKLQRGQPWLFLKLNLFILIASVLVPKQFTVMGLATTWSFSFT